MEEYFERTVFSSEAKLEKFFCEKIKEVGGWAIKFTSPGTNGVPDRIVFYERSIYLVEFKSLYGKLSPTQKVVHAQLKKLGIEVYVIRTKEKVEDFIEQMTDPETHFIRL